MTSRGTRWLVATLLLVWPTAHPPPTYAGEERSATINGEVDAARWKGIRLKRLPRGTSLGVELEVDGAVALILLPAKELSRFPAEAIPAFSSQVVDRMRFALKIPESGDYILIVDNRTGSEARRFTVIISAAPPER